MSKATGKLPGFVYDSKKREVHCEVIVPRTKSRGRKRATLPAATTKHLAIDARTAEHPHGAGTVEVASDWRNPGEPSAKGSRLPLLCGFMGFARKEGN